MFEKGYLSQVLGFELEDGRRIVVKVRPWAERLLACAEVHASLFLTGYPCPRPISATEQLAGWAVSAESLVQDQEQLALGSDSPRLFADALSWFLREAPQLPRPSTLNPSPPWTDWDDRGRQVLWPEPDDPRDTDLNPLPRTWVDAAASTVRTFLLEVSDKQPVVGHLDWYSANLGWRDRKLVAVFDWDSVGAQPEACVAGLAAAVWPATGGAGEEATVEQSEQFLEHYAGGRQWSDAEMRTAWAAGVWVRCFDAKKAEAINENPEVVITRQEARDRLRLADLPDDL